MTKRPSILLTCAALSALLGACNLAGSVAGGPTRTADEVLATAKAAAELTRQATFQTPPPTDPPPTFTPPPGTPTATVTNTPAPPEVSLKAKYNVYIRKGPGEEFSHVGFFLESEEGVAIGRFDHFISGTWWYVRIPSKGIEGWVWEGAVDVLGDSSGVPIIENP